MGKPTFQPLMFRYYRLRSLKNFMVLHPYSNEEGYGPQHYFSFSVANPKSCNRGSNPDPESSSHKTATKYKAQSSQIKYKPGPSGMRTVRQGVSEAASALKVT